MNTSRLFKTILQGLILAGAAGMLIIIMLYNVTTPFTIYLNVLIVLIFAERLIEE